MITDVAAAAKKHPDHDPDTTADEEVIAPGVETARDAVPRTGVDPTAGPGVTRAAATWSGLVAGALVLVLLLVFIVQNIDRVRVNLFLWTVDLPLGVTILIAAIAGALVMAAAGSIRIRQVRKAAKRASA